MNATAWLWRWLLHPGVSETGLKLRLAAVVLAGVLVTTASVWYAVARYRRGRRRKEGMQ